MGDAFSGVLHGVLGIAAVLFPLIGLGWGIALLRDRSPDERMRMFIGFVILALGALGVLSIVRGNPSVFAPVRDAAMPRAPEVQGFADAGGFIGTLGAYPLSRVVSPAGAFLVDLGLAVVGALIMTGTSFVELGHKLSHARGRLRERDEARRAERGAKAEAKLERQRVKDERAAAKAEEAATSGNTPKRKLTERLGLDRARRRGVRGRTVGRARRAGGDRRPRPSCVRRSGRRCLPREAAWPHDLDARRPVPASPLDLLRTAPPSTNDGIAREGHHGGPRPHAVDVRGRRSRGGGPSRPDRHDVRGRGRRRAPR